MKKLWLRLSLGRNIAVFILFLGVFFAQNASAQTAAYGFSIVPADFALETEDIITMAKAVLVGLGGMWGWRKVVKSLNRC